MPSKVSGVIVLPGGIVGSRQVQNTWAGPHDDLCWKGLNFSNLTVDLRAPLGTDQHSADGCQKQARPATTTFFPPPTLPSQTQRSMQGADPEIVEGRSTLFQSTCRSTFSDFSSHRDALKKPRIFYDIVKERHLERCNNQASTHFHGKSMTREMIKTPNLKSAKAPATLYTKKEEMRKARSLAELAVRQSQSQQHQTGRGLRPAGQTFSDQFRSYSMKEMSDARSSPSFTSWHELVDPMAFEEPWCTSPENPSFRSTMGSSRGFRSRR